MQWDRYVFLGEYCDILGTAVFFEKKKGEGMGIGNDEKLVEHMWL